MDSDKDFQKGLIEGFAIGMVILIIVVFSLNGKIKESEKEISNLSSQNDYCNSALNEANNNLNEANDNLYEANSNIEEANGLIEKAHSYAWSSYDEMGYALDKLYTVDTIQ